MWESNSLQLATVINLMDQVGWISYTSVAVGSLPVATVMNQRYQVGSSNLLFKTKFSRVLACDENIIRTPVAILPQKYLIKKMFFENVKASLL